MFPWCSRPPGAIGKAVVVAVLLLCLSAGFQPCQAEKVELVVAEVPRKGSTNPVDIAGRRVFEAFLKRYPEIAVRGMTKLRIEGDRREATDFLAMAGGVAPDVLYLFGRKIGNYHSQDFLRPLDDYLEAHKQRTGKDYRGVSAPAAVWEVAQVDDHVYAVPLSYYSLALMVRRDFFAKAGLPVRSPKDWDEFYRWTRRLTYLPVKEGTEHLGYQAVYGTYLPKGYSAGWHMMPYIWSAQPDAEVVKAWYTREDGQQVQVPAPMPDWRKLHVELSNPEDYYPMRSRKLDQLSEKGVPADYSMSDLEWRLAINDQAGVETIQFYRRLLHQPWVRFRYAGRDYERDLTAAEVRAGKVVITVQDVLDYLDAWKTHATENERRRYDEQIERFADQADTVIETIVLDDDAMRNRVYHGVAETESEDPSRLNFYYATSLNTLKEVGESPDRSNWVPVMFPPRKAEFPPAAFMAGHYLAINSSTKDPQVLDAAWKYIEFVTGPDAQRIRVQTYVEHGLAEYIRPANLEALGYQAELEQIPPERKRLWRLLETHAKVEPYCKGFQNVQTLDFAEIMDAVRTDEPVPAEDGQSWSYSRRPKEILDPIVRQVNMTKLGRLPDEVIQRRRMWAWIIAIFGIGLLIGAFYLTIRLVKRLAERSAKDSEGFGVAQHSWRRTAAVVLFLLPAIASIILWAYYPLARGSVMAFQDYKILGGSEWVGLRNFIEAASSREFWQYLLQTGVYLAMSLSMGFVAPIVLAILLTEVPKGKVLFRTLYYLPAVTTGLVTMFMWKQLLYDEKPSGALNRILLSFDGLPGWQMVPMKLLLAGILIFLAVSLVRILFSRDTEGLGKWLPGLVGILLVYYLGQKAYQIAADYDGWLPWWTWLSASWDIEPRTFLSNKETAMFWVVVPTVWAGMGPGCLIYLAALKSIPDSQYEAADVDGAGIWSKAVNVLLPNLKALILINLVGAVVGAMHASQNIFVMTGGGPENSTMTAGLWIWFNAYMFLNFGLATAMAWVVAAMLIGFTLYQLRLLQQMQFRTASAAEEKK
jgi:ABC-type sugar transport system permease subunit/ABC-type glycerol-3-phosphate transport system substrate-binding protein